MPPWFPPRTTYQWPPTAAASRHIEIRNAVVKHLEENPDEYRHFVETEKVRWDLYLSDMKDPKTWGSQVEISIISKLYSLNFTIYREQPEPTVDMVYGGPIDESEHSKKSIRPSHIEVCYAGNNHYDLVVCHRYRDLATCMQGIIYDLLFTTLQVPKPPGLEKGETYINAEFETWRLANRTRWKQHQMVEARYPYDGQWYTAKVVGTPRKDGDPYSVEFVGYNEGAYDVKVAHIRSDRVPEGFRKASSGGGNSNDSRSPGGGGGGRGGGGGGGGGKKKKRGRKSNTLTLTDFPSPNSGRKSGGAADGKSGAGSSGAGAAAPPQLGTSAFPGLPGGPTSSAAGGSSEGAGGAGASKPKVSAWGATFSSGGSAATIAKDRAAAVVAAVAAAVPAPTTAAGAATNTAAGTTTTTTTTTGAAAAPPPAAAKGGIGGGNGGGRGRGGGSGGRGGSVRAGAVANSAAPVPTAPVPAPVAAAAASASTAPAQATPAPVQTGPVWGSKKNWGQAFAPPTPRAAGVAAPSATAGKPQPAAAAAAAGDVASDSAAVPESVESAPGEPVAPGAVDATPAAAAAASGKVTADAEPPTAEAGSAAAEATAADVQQQGATEETTAAASVAHEDKKVASATTAVSVHETVPDPATVEGGDGSSAPTEGEGEGKDDVPPWS